MRGLHDLRSGYRTTFVFDSGSSLSFLRHLSTSTIKSAYAMRVLDRGRGSLVPDIFGGGCVNCVFGNIGGVVANAFEAAANKNKIQVAPQLIRVLCHSID